MSFTPLDEALLSSSLLKKGPDCVATWALVLASADKLGESNMTTSAVASLLRIADERVAAAFDVLCSPDPESRNQEHEGRRLLRRPGGGWTLVSHQKYQRRASRPAAAERQRRYAENKKAREAECERAAKTCAEPGCGAPAESNVAGLYVCLAHAFDKQPGEEG